MADARQDFLFCLDVSNLFRLDYDRLGDHFDCIHLGSDGCVSGWSEMPKTCSIG